MTSAAAGSRAHPGFGPLQVAWLLVVSLGVLRLPGLPPAWACWLLLALGLGLFAARGVMPRLLALGLVALGWTGTAGQLALSERIDPAPDAPLELVLRVDGLPRGDALSARFAAIVEAAPEGQGSLIGRRLQLSWFAEPPPEVFPGELWRLPVRLRPPRGLRNPGGFDFERHALVSRIAALGSVAGPGERLESGAGVDALRAMIAGHIEDSGVAAPALLRGLVVGDTRGLDDADWDRLRQTGLSHLLAISGLHIGLVAGFAALLARLLYLVAPTLGLRVPLPQAAALAALAAAIAYALLAGLSLPTLRTLLMLGVALAAVLLRREVPFGHSLGLAAAALWLLDPLALLTPGFWLSLGGVFWLLACVPRGEGWRAALVGLVRAQLVLGLALLPLSVAFFGGGSLVGLPLNLLAVPWVTLLVVPVLLLSVLCLPWPLLSLPLLQLAGLAMQELWALAGWAAGLPAAYLHLPEPGPLALGLSLAGLLWLFAPRGVPGRGLAALLLLPLLWPPRDAPGPGGYRVDVLDVGQGLSVLVRTADHALLFDTAARARGGFDLGDAVVVPALRALGVRRIDRLVVSHGDVDHAGGLEAVRAAFPDASLQSGEPGRSGGGPCQAGERWNWDGVEFAWLHPPEHFPELGNESSCVLRIAGRGGVTLLPGDIGSVIEQRLLREQGAALRAELLVVPHHGSRGSSSPAFVDAVAARWAVVSASAGNRFGHPHPEVVERYAQSGSAVLSTAASGRIGFLFEAYGARLERVERRDAPRFWQQPPAGP
ncbi:DNA internalization-related competence protein ComEC/Rec2 [Pseudomarimonas salicorniae]|uniref:DNA internalization-related competence protein ComEC/Rec2 n=1 Tax=Pseudomarimonas salicorniae TaxID=2933270 RepID=A0ABT0GEI5_9GAMM|nr:DNA internalization-related competence protein ComEC/Rec2 [Lysobacter sp. CAU 1642]MCK7592958.1 DNA internalization-related competence protein ComEC/Rec2 [Lysobacter sp. CAU 1642]